jgi:hypothetical protein
MTELQSQIILITLFIEWLLVIINLIRGELGI